LNTNGQTTKRWIRTICRVSIPALGLGTALAFSAPASAQTTPVSAQTALVAAENAQTVTAMQGGNGGNGGSGGNGGAGGNNNSGMSPLKNILLARAGWISRVKNYATKLESVI
jgi:hypothetical protein